MINTSATASVVNNSTEIPLDFGPDQTKLPIPSTSDFFDFPPSPGGPGGGFPSLSNQLTLNIIPYQIVNSSFLRGFEMLNCIFEVLGNLLSTKEQAVPSKDLFASKIDSTVSSKDSFFNSLAFGAITPPQTNIQCYTFSDTTEEKTESEKLEEAAKNAKSKAAKVTKAAAKLVEGKAEVTEAAQIIAAAAELIKTKAEAADVGEAADEAAEVVAEIKKILEKEAEQEIKLNALIAEIEAEKTRLNAFIVEAKAALDVHPDSD